MTAALELVDRRDSDAILAMHRALMQGHDASIAGRWCDQQVWIGGDCFGPHGAAFVPPHHDSAAQGLRRRLRRAANAMSGIPPALNSLQPPRCATGCETV